VGAHDRGAVGGGDVDELGIRTSPRVVEEVRPGLADRGTDLGAPGVDGDDQVGERLPDPRDEVDDPGLLLGDTDVALIPPMSTISAPCSTTSRTRSKAASSAQVAPLS
jgi:hypothetical protein